MGKGCIVIGAAMLDIVMEIDRIPKSGTDVYAKGQSMMVGGCAYNVADILKHCLHQSELECMQISFAKN